MVSPNSMLMAIRYVNEIRRKSGGESGHNMTIQTLRFVKYLTRWVLVTMTRPIF